MDPQAQVTLMYLGSALQLPVHTSSSTEALGRNIRAHFDLPDDIHLLLVDEKRLDVVLDHTLPLGAVYELQTKPALPPVPWEEPPLAAREAVEGKIGESRGATEGVGHVSEEKRGWANRHRARVLVELLTTERTFMDCLETMTTVFRGPMCEKDKSQRPALLTAPLSQQKRERLFSKELDNLLPTHGVVLMEFEKILSPLEATLTTLATHNFAYLNRPYHPTQHIQAKVEAGIEVPCEEQMAICSRLGQSFLQFSNYLKPHTFYFNNYDRAQQCCQALKNEDKYGPGGKNGFLRYEQEVGNLGALLITPIQRVLRYPMLLSELIKSVDPKAKAHTDLTAAYNAIKTIADYCNTEKQKSEQRGDVFDVQRLLARRGSQKELVGQVNRILISNSGKEADNKISRVRVRVGASPPESESVQAWLFDAKFLVMRRDQVVLDIDIDTNMQLQVTAVVSGSSHFNKLFPAKSRKKPKGLLGGLKQSFKNYRTRSREYAAALEELYTLEAELERVGVLNRVNTQSVFEGILLMLVDETASCALDVRRSNLARTARGEVEKSPDQWAVVQWVLMPDCTMRLHKVVKRGSPSDDAQQSSLLVELDLSEGVTFVAEGTQVEAASLAMSSEESVAVSEGGTVDEVGKEESEWAYLLSSGDSSRQRENLLREVALLGGGTFNIEYVNEEDTSEQKKFMFEVKEAGRGKSSLFQVRDADTLDRWLAAFEEVGATINT